MCKLPKITIVTPSYNQALYLEATLQSVLNQDYPNLEYIVMDGGSTDGSIEILKKYSDRLTYWESKPDKGQADAIYRGFERATGEILGFVNSDDLLLPGALLTVGNWYVLHPQEEWVVGGCVIIGPEGKIIRDQLNNPVCNFGERVTFMQLLFFGCTFNQPAAFWRRSVFVETGGFDRDLRFSFDYDLFLRLAMRRPSGKINKVIASFRIHAESKTTNLNKLKLEEDVLLHNKYGRWNHNIFIQKIIGQWFRAKQSINRRCLKILLASRIKHI